MSPVTPSPAKPSIDALKASAKALRRELEARGAPVSHAQALEIVARQNGFRDWNTAHAAAGNRPPAPFALGQKVAGRYLGRPCAGEVIAVREIAGGERYALTIQFEAPVNVSAFDSFEVLRTRIHTTVDRRGRSAEKTSDGRPHVELSL